MPTHLAWRHLDKILGQFRSDTLAYSFGECGAQIPGVTVTRGCGEHLLVFLSRIVGYVVDKQINKDGNGIGYFVTSMVCQVVFGVLASIIVAWFSRYREFRADAGAASYMGQPNSMISALATLGRVEVGCDDRTNSVCPNGACLAVSGIPIGLPGMEGGRAPSPTTWSVLVAWKDSSHARRAVHDALPILVHAKRVSVVGVGDEVSADQLDAVATHLRRHKVKACHWHIPDTAGDVCSELLAQAQREAAKLIVTGVYSRGPMIERVLGGVTANMLKYADISWFMAH